MGRPSSRTHAAHQGTPRFPPSFRSVFSVGFSARLIIAAGIKVDGTLDALDEANFVAAVEVLHVKRGVDGSNGLDVVELRRHPESFPSSPAVPGSEEGLETTAFDVCRELLVPRLYLVNLLGLDDL
jgi:hypothetical protein